MVIVYLLAPWGGLWFVETSKQSRIENALSIHPETLIFFDF
jgi:hypothetical protein